MSELREKLTEALSGWDKADAIDAVDALLPVIEQEIAEADIAGQMRHITAEVVRGDVPLSDSEEMIADLRARVSHAEAERDEARRLLADALRDRNRIAGETA